jgi:Ala-tRNA(Pro) deacylase
MQVCQFLTDKRITFESLVHPPAFTAQKRAKFLRIPGRLVVKGVVLVGPHGFFLAVLPATHRVDTNALAQHLRGPVRLATAREIVLLFSDCEFGVVPPFGRQYGLPTLLDDSIPPDAEIVLEANTCAEAVRMRCRDFERLERPRRIKLSTATAAK